MAGSRATSRLIRAGSWHSQLDRGEGCALHTLVALQSCNYASWLCHGAGLCSARQRSMHPLNHPHPQTDTNPHPHTHPHHTDAPALQAAGAAAAAAGSRVAAQPSVSASHARIYFKPTGAAMPSTTPTAATPPEPPSRQGSPQLLPFTKPGFCCHPTGQALWFPKEDDAEG